MKAVSLSSTLALGLVLLTLAGHSYANYGHHHGHHGHHGHHAHPHLKIGFYNGKCGKHDVEKVIFDAVKKKITDDPDTVSDLIRLSFHDCFVRGCDASVLLNGKNTEKAAKANQDLGGFKTVDDIKEVVEKTCPGVVSCADVIVIASRAAVHLAGGKWYEVETGRRDSLVSHKDEATKNIPPPTISVPAAIKLFAKKGLSKDDFVVLLGGHTVGTTHCHSFKERLNNFHNTNKPDPTLSASLLKLMKETCKKGDEEVFLDQTPNSHFTIDNDYYKQILAHNGTLEIDQNMASSPLTRGLVKELAYSRYQFLDEFGPAMVRMSRIGVLTGHHGEIRKTCGSIN